ncbi:MAG: polysaccharide deacetylase family protein [Phycisphaerae bacterium]
MVNSVSTTSISGNNVSSRCLVVMYHYVRHERTPTGEGIHAITPDQLRSQVQELITDFTPINWPDLVGWLAGRHHFSNDTVLFTFDDGLKDHLRFAAPVLEEFGIQGIFFVPGIVLLEPVMLTAHATHLLIGALGMQAFVQRLKDRMTEFPHLPELQEAEKETAVKVYHYEEREAAIIKYLLNFKLEPAASRQLIESLFVEEIGAVADWSRKTYLNWEDLVRLQGRGHTIGGHGFLHDPYTTFDQQQRDSDLRRSSDVLQEGLGPAVRPFSYPFGQVDEETAEVCRRAGFVHGFTTQRDWTSLQSPSMLLPRVDTIHVTPFLKDSTLCQ